MFSAISDKSYICPGETHPITRSVHLSRLAAFYPACRDCPLRSETGQLPKQTVERLQSTERRVARKSLLTTEGVRGVYLNELTRKKAQHHAASLAALLWEDAPLLGSIGNVKRRSRQSGPTVVVGYDERPSSPDIVTGVVWALRRMGCQVIDISLVSEPCFRFLVGHVQASGGVYVTGAGCDVSWTGMNLVGAGSLPLSLVSNTHREDEAPAETPGILTLNRLEAKLRKSIGRPTRQAGRYRTFQAVIPYEAGLWKHFHALRPLTVVCGCPVRSVRQTLTRVFETLPCRLVFTDIPNRARNPADADDADVRRIARAVLENRADMGLLIDDDGIRCGFLDEQGRLVLPRDVTRLLSELLLAENPGARVAIESTAAADFCSLSTSNRRRCLDGGSTMATMAQTIADGGALFGGGDSGRYWFADSFPACDAVLALAKVLDALSRSDAPFSNVVRFRDEDQTTC